MKSRAIFPGENASHILKCRKLVYKDIRKDMKIRRVSAIWLIIDKRLV